jgi:protein-glutamine gamma-glutamyltransferase
MNVERLLQMHVAALATIGAVLLSMGQRDSLLPLLGIFAALTSVVFTDTLRWFSLHRMVANLTAVVALFVSLNGFFETDTRGQLAAIAKLLTYMQVALFYQRKTPRVYWQLSLLSLLQVVVAAALNTRFEFGVLLVLYAALAIATVALLFVHRELLSVAGTAPGTPRGLRRSHAAGRPESGSPSARWLLRTPLLTPPATTEPWSRQIVGWGFAKQVAGLAVTTLVFALVLFFAAPRLDSVSRRAWHVRAQHVVGFTSEVRLGSLDEVLQSDETVMRVSFRDAKTNKPYRVYGQPYLRGSVLTRYLNVEGESRWVQPGRVWPPQRLTADEGLASVLAATRQLTAGSRGGWRPMAPPPALPQVRQDIVLEPIEEAVLFGVYPVYRLPGTPAEIGFHPLTEQLFRTSIRDTEQRGEFRYSLLTTGFRGGLQVDATPYAPRTQSPADRFLLDRETAYFDAARFPRLREIAAQVVREQNLSPTDNVAVARALRNHFQAPGRYTYSLDFRQVPRHSQLDPIEDFVAGHRTGHCVYFASALAMMLRSQGIPSRLVIGFKCEGFNAVGGYYQVLQRHAHAWVEAYLTSEEVDTVVPPGSDTGPTGGWLRLDPTPGADQDTAQQLQKGLMGYVDDGLDYARTVWSDYILGLTAKRQRETIYSTVAEKTDPKTWSNWLAELNQRRRDFVEWWGAWWRRWWWLAVLVVLAVGGGFGARMPARRKEIGAVVTRVKRWAARWTGRQTVNGKERRPLPVPFFRRFELLLARHGGVRAAAQTPREWVVHFATSPVAAATTAVAPLLDTVVAAYYRVRFGQLPLEAQEAEALEAALNRLEDLLKTNPQG